MKKSLIIIAIFTVAISSALSLQHKKNNEKRHDRKCKMEKLTPEVLDKLNKLKNEFDLKLESTDLVELNLLREKVKNNRIEIHEHIMEIKNSEGTSKEKHQKIKNYLQSQNDERESIKQSLTNIIENYPEEIEILKSDLLELKNSLPRNKELRKEKNSENKLHKFLLTTQFKAKNHIIKDIVGNSEKINVTVENHSIKFNTELESSNTIITIYDFNGNEIAIKDNVNIINGLNEIDLLSLKNNLNKGIYLLVLKNENGINTGKFIYTK